jgi:hypothetical protein
MNENAVNRSEMIASGVSVTGGGRGERFGGLGTEMLGGDEHVRERIVNA